MRHGKKFNHLSRKSQHRHAMLSNMAASLITHKRINTTLAKAKALRVYVEPIISLSKNNTTHSRRMAFRYLQNKNAVATLFREIAPKVAERNGGYTRILKTGFRHGDNATTCLIELVDFNENYLKQKTSQTTSVKKTRRGRRRKKERTEGEKPISETTQQTPTPPQQETSGQLPPNPAPSTNGSGTEAN
jgi:large subunit ribosomal protein L17